MKDSFLVDTHCHIDLFEDPAQIIEETEREAVYTIAVTNAPFVFRHTADLVSGCRYIRAAAGLHPELVATHGDQLEMLRPLLDETRYVGEIGLDYTTADESVRRAQRRVLTKILEWSAHDTSKIFTLHSRRATTDVMSAIGDSFSGRTILHWFSGSNKELDRACELGVYFSVNPAMVSSSRGIELISRMPREKILTESDGPFVKSAGKQARPVSIDDVIQKLGLLWRESKEEARQTVYENFRSLLGVET